MWLRGEGGLVRLDLSTGTRKRIAYGDGLIDDFVRRLAVQGKHLWAGTDYGLTRIDAGEL